MTPSEPFQIPRAEDAEQAVIGGLCLDNNAIDRIGALHAQRDEFRPGSDYIRKWNYRVDTNETAIYKP